MDIPIHKSLPSFGDVVVVHQALKKPLSFENRGTTGVCLGHDSRVSGGVLVVLVVDGFLQEVCSAKGSAKCRGFLVAKCLSIFPTKSSA